MLAAFFKHKLFLLIKKLISGIFFQPFELIEQIEPFERFYFTNIPNLKNPNRYEFRNGNANTTRIMYMSTPPLNRSTGPSLEKHTSCTRTAVNSFRHNTMF